MDKLSWKNIIAIMVLLGSLIMIWFFHLDVVAIPPNNAYILNRLTGAVTWIHNDEMAIVENQAIEKK